MTLFLRYCQCEKGIKIERLRIEALTPSLVTSFLDYLEKHRSCTVRTRNQRLAALHSFFRYLQTEDPSAILQCQQILAIPFRRCEHKTVSFLAVDDLTGVLHEPDQRSFVGRRDAVMLSLLYDSGARVQELIDLRTCDVRLDSPAQLRLFGKGRKERVVPLMQSTVVLLREYIDERGLAAVEHLNDPLFQSARGVKLTRSGVRYILQKYVRRSALPGRAKRAAVTPHVLRHTKAMHLLQAGTPLPIIRDFLGHAHVKTTEIYARADLESKRRALEKVSSPTQSVKLIRWNQQKDLIAWLKAL
jgi:site-specific recombinase XerD